MSRMLGGSSDVFELAVGLKSNCHKLCHVKVGKLGLLNVDWVNVFQCKKAHLPIIYLGLPFGATPSSKVFWDPVLKRMESRMASCKRKFHNKGGRLVLVKAVLSNILANYLSIFEVPERVALAIENSQRSSFMEMVL
ncbi:hypothetical protein Ddye_014630 [Dipteronia dyeriana]|uniref:Uncharacterized protein n=1 Tax=Dipteronia dyeriana TaxID=168575 RepID=A0AAE0CKS4_9ROSI|nr:hypothetical protein Ddye_014630 [Dipteronia dyeriana]